PCYSVYRSAQVGQGHEVPRCLVRAVEDEDALLAPQQEHRLFRTKEDVAQKVELLGPSLPGPKRGAGPIVRFERLASQHSAELAFGCLADKRGNIALVSVNGSSGRTAHPGTLPAASAEPRRLARRWRRD